MILINSFKGKRFVCLICCPTVQFDIFSQMAFCIMHHVSYMVYHELDTTRGILKEKDRKETQAGAV